MLTAKHMQEGIVLEANGAVMFGVLRKAGGAKKIVVMVPANTGTRIGPQRIYVEIAQSLLEAGISSFCVDLPFQGDGVQGPAREAAAGDAESKLTAAYGRYLETVTEHLRSRFGYTEFVYLSISVGCLPILNFAKRNNCSQVVLLSPNTLSAQIAAVNTKNLHAYRQKLFRWHTWRKLFTLQLSFSRIVDNTFNISQRRIQKHSPVKASSSSTSDAKRVSILCIYGSQDTSIPECRNYWQEYLQSGRCEKVEERVIEGSDHSFFGWSFKRRVCTYITEWLSR